MDGEVRAYVDGIASAQRPLFDRLHELILREFPGVTIELAYKMPTYRVGDRRIHLAAWRHGVSIYGWDKSADGGVRRAASSAADQHGDVADPS